MAPDFVGPRRLTQGPVGGACKRYVYPVLCVHDLAQTAVFWRFGEGRLGSERVIITMGRHLLSA